MQTFEDVAAAMRRTLSDMAGTLAEMAAEARPPAAVPSVDRRSAMLGLAAAPAALAMAPPASADASPLPGLIEAHRRAVQGFADAVERLDERQHHPDAPQFPRELIYVGQIPLRLEGLDKPHVEKKVDDILSRIIGAPGNFTPELRAAMRRECEALKATAVAEADRIRAEQRAVKTAFGLTALEAERDAAERAETAALRALFQHRPRTLDEVTMLARYLVDSDPDLLFEAYDQDRELMGAQWLATLAAVGADATPLAA